MKLKRILLGTIALIMMISILSLSNESIAAGKQLNETLYFKVNELMSENSNVSNENDGKIGYAIGEPGIGNGIKIWNIMKTDSNGTAGKSTYLYCIKSGQGFQNTNQKGIYTESYDMKAEQSSIIPSNTNSNPIISNISEENYKALLALADLIYVPFDLNENKVDDEEKLNDLMENYTISEAYNGAYSCSQVSGYNSYKLKDYDDLLKAVQQAAIWYFTNSNQNDDNKELYDHTDADDNSSWLQYMTDPMKDDNDQYKYQPLSDYEKVETDKGQILANQAHILYKALIEKAKANASANKINTSTKLTLYTSSTDKSNTQPLMEVTREPEGEFDLALRKYITKVERDGQEVTLPTRVPTIDTDDLDDGSDTTASYKHRKDPVTVKTGDIVTYNITIYNEGDKAGRATKIVDQLPTGLEFKGVIEGGAFELDTYDTTTNKVTLKRKASDTNNLEPYSESGDLDSETIQIKCEVKAQPNETGRKILTNVAWISEEINADDNDKVITTEEGEDRDSEPGTAPSVNKDNMSDYKGNNSNKDTLGDSNYFYKGQQDDDDFEKLVLEPTSEFDLKLIKRITEVNGNEVPERIESVDVSRLNTTGTDSETTADYKLNKDPIYVKKGDIVTYTFRIYNEGYKDGYAQEITEDIPEGLEFIWSEKEGEELDNDSSFTDEEKEAIEFNQKYLWVAKYGSNNLVESITTDYLSKESETRAGDNLIKAFGENDGTKTEEDLDYKEVSVKLKVISDDTSGEIIRNEAAITEDADEDGKPVVDRDSDTEDWKKYEDDEDYDNIVLGSFDLALRKFIIAVSSDETVENTEYLKNSDGTYTREPEVDTSKLNTVGEDGKKVTTATYNHTKEPVIVQKGDTIIYMLRVYNEGDIDGYAAEIKDHLPSNLEFVDGEFNEEYGWEVSEDGRTVTTTYLKDSLIDAAKTEDGEITLSYQEVPIMCRVKDSAITNENITNIADITKYLDANKQPAEDRDSEEDNVKLPSDWPGYKDDETGSYIPGQEDDDDFEKVLVKEFDLALRKWVTQAIVTYNGKQAVSNTGHDAWDDPEEIVKLEIPRGKINDVTIKFRYSIRVYNQGDVEGYAKEITDYIPEGLKFVASDNPGWTDEGNNVISTRLLENKLLQPGEYADIEVVLTWINSQDNMGVKINTAEISEDDNPYGLPDKDSTPDNQVKGEDDIDDAPVMLSTSTGAAPTYFGLTFIILTTLGGGIFLIKKYVL